MGIDTWSEKAVEQLTWFFSSEWSTPEGIKKWSLIMVDDDLSKSQAVKFADYSSPHPYKLSEDQHSCVVNIYELVDEVRVFPLACLEKKTESLNF